jgi:endonuclease/exonuclease/phosphatase (EEP) superfamily protein YafD
MRILHYNILDGCAGQEARLAGVHAWVKAQRADIVGLAECNGWNLGGGMKAHAAACGFEHSHLLEGDSQYLMALMAHENIELIEQIIAGVHHGILHALIAGIHYVYSHFSPHERLMRIHEAKTVAAIVLNVNAPLVMMGDLNSHSPLDRSLCENFATPENRAWATDFEAQQILLAAGLNDIVQRDSLGTLNTAYHKTAATRRVDYIYVNDAFLARFPNTKGTTIRGPEVAALSDHFPLICDT